MYLVSMIKEENKMEKKMMAEAMPKLKKMDETEFLAFGPELSPINEPEIEPEIPTVTGNIFYGPDSDFGDSEFDDSKFDDSEFDGAQKALPVETPKQEQTLVLEGPAVAGQ